MSASVFSENICGKIILNGIIYIYIYICEREIDNLNI